MATVAVAETRVEFVGADCRLCRTSAACCCWSGSSFCARLAMIAHVRGELVHVARLFGASAQPRETHGITLFYLEQAQHDQVMAGLREGLGQAEFQRLLDARH